MSYPLFPNMESNTIYGNVVEFALSNIRGICRILARTKFVEVCWKFAKVR